MNAASEVRARFPWGELGALGAIYVALLAWSGRARSTGIPGFVVLGSALLVAVLPRLVARLVRPSSLTEPTGVASDDGTLEAGVAWRGERALRIACAGAAVALGSMVHGGVAESSLVAGARVAGLVAVLGGVGWLARSVSQRSGVLFSSWIGRALGAALALGPAVLLLAVALGSTQALLRGWVVLVGLGLFVRVLAERTRSGDPFERARLAWLLGASSLLALAGAQGGWALARAASLGHAASLLSPARAVLPTAAVTVAACAFAAAGAAGVALDRAERYVRVAWLGALGALVLAAPGALRDDPWLAATGALVGALVAGAVASLRAWEPAGGALSRAVAKASAACVGAERTDELASALLAPLRDASGDLRAPASMWLPDEEVRYALDVAGAAHGAPFVPASERALLTYLRARGASVVAAEALRPLAVRRPELRPVLATLDANEALVALALAEPEAGGVAAVLLVPRGRRRGRVTAEEALALQGLSVRASRALATARALERARSRAVEAERVAERADGARIDAEKRASQAQARCALSVRAPGSMREAWVAYSAAARELDKALAASARAAGPVQLFYEPGCSAGAAAMRLHALSSRAAGPCVLFDAAAVHPRGAERALEGDVERPGWIESARGGTLLIEQAQALSSDAVGALVRVLRGERGADAARLVFASPGPLRELGAPAELCALLSESEGVELPPLRAREEDLEPLALLALDRACRVAVRAPLGLSREALAALRSYAWPGNERELFDVLERAAYRARGDRLVLEDLPSAVVATAPVGAGAAGGEGARGRASVPAAGEDDATYEALERRILESALERTGGNKSEAARSLGLARTTFLDKLRKHGLRA